MAGGEQTHPESNVQTPPPPPPPAPRGEQTYTPPPPAPYEYNPMLTSRDSWLEDAIAALAPALAIPTQNQFGIGSDPYYTGPEMAAGNAATDYLSRLLRTPFTASPPSSTPAPVRSSAAPVDIASTSTSYMPSASSSNGFGIESLVPGGYITGHYGQKGGPYPETGHIGLDIGTGGKSAPISAPMEGTVVENGWSDGYGWYVKLQHPDGTYTLYAHMASQSPLQQGGMIAAGQQIGMTGMTGHANGIHLHFEAYDANGNRIDPEGWLGGDLGGGSAPTAPPAETPAGGWSSADAVNAIRYWSQHYGYSDSFLQFAMAVAYGESGMNPYAGGDMDKGGSYGIYQFFTNGGRGTGIDKETLFNPWYQAEVNLPYLFKAFQRFGGDTGWQNNPAYVLKYAWQAGQSSRMPTDRRVAEVLAKVRTMDFNTPVSEPPARNPSPVNTTSPYANYPLMNGFMDSLYGGQSYSPASMFLSGLMGGGYSPSPGSEFLQNILGDTTPQQMQPAIDYLSGLTGKLFSF